MGFPSTESSAYTTQPKAKILMLKAKLEPADKASTPFTDY